MWTGGELTALCTQNSAIARELGLLQAALPYDIENVDDVFGPIGNGVMPTNAYGYGPGPLATNGMGPWQHQTYALSAGAPLV